MFGSLFSDRYSRKREFFYARYEATRSRFPNLPHYERPKEPRKSKFKTCNQKKRRPADYDYEEWIAGNFVSIVVRRAVEQWSCKQLMDLAPSNCIDFCSWRSWPGEARNGEGEELRIIRRSLRLTDKPNLKPMHIGHLRQQDTKVAIKWQQRLPTLETGIKNERTVARGNELNSTFIDGCCHESQPQCNMCGSRFGESSNLQLHSLDDCRKNLLATLGN